MRKIFLLTIIIIAVLTVSAAAAAENVTQTHEAADNPTDEIEVSSDNEQPLSINGSQKENLNVEMICPDAIVKPIVDDYEPTVEFGNVPSDYREPIKIYVNGKLTKTYMIDDIENYIHLNELDYGLYVILVELPGTDKYNPVNLTHSLQVTTGYINIAKLITGNQGIRITLKEGSSGYLTVNVDGKQFKKIQIKARKGDLSYATVGLGSLKKGTHTVEAIYVGDQSPKKITKKATVKVEPEVYMDFSNPYNLIDNNTVAYKSSAEPIYISLGDDITKKLEVYVDGVKYDHVTSKDNNNYVMDLSALDVGTHTVEFTYPGDSKYSKRTITKTLNVVPWVSVANGLQYYSLKYNASEFYINLPDDAEGNLSVYVNGQLYGTSPAENGVAKVKMTGLGLGTYSIKANYTESDYDVIGIEQECRVLPDAIYPSSKKYGDPETFQFITNPEINTNITVRDRDQYVLDVEIINGQGNFTLTENPNRHFLDMGNTVEINYELNGTTYRATYPIETTPIPAVFKGFKDLTMYYTDTKNLEFVLYGSTGKIADDEIAAVTVASTTKYPRSMENGVIIYKISGLAPGTYKMTVSYDQTKVTKKLTVKHVVNLKTVSVKRSAKKLVLAASLKKGKTPIKYKVVTFKFAGKTYKAKTDKNGLAKVTIPKTVLSKLKVGKTVTYQATYLKDTVKKTAKVQK